MRTATNDEMSESAKLPLLTAWVAHDGVGIRPVAQNRVVRLLHGGADDPRNDRLVLAEGTEQAPEYQVLAGSRTEVRERFEQLRIEVMQQGLYAHTPMFETAELLPAADAGAIWLNRRLVIMDTKQDISLPAFEQLDHDRLITAAAQRGSRTLRRLPRGRRALLCLTPAGGPQMSLYGPDVLRADTFSYLTALIEDFAERCSEHLSGVNLLDVLIADAPEPPIVLDLLCYESTSISARPWIERQALLRQLLAELPEPSFDLRLIDLDTASDGVPLSDHMVVGEGAAYGETGWIATERAA